MSYLAGETSRVRLGHERAGHPLPQSRGHGQDAGDARRAVGRAHDPGGGRRLVRGGVRGAPRASPSSGADAVTDEYLRLMRACWTREPVELAGRLLRYGRGRAPLPKPRQKGGIPIWVGGAHGRRAAPGGRALRRMASHRPAGLPPCCSRTSTRDKVAIIRDWARKAGRDPRAITLSLPLPAGTCSRSAPSPREASGTLFRGTAAEVIGDIKAYEALGVTHFVFDPVAQDLRGLARHHGAFRRRGPPQDARQLGPPCASAA